MKKILFGLLFSLMAFQVNAATVNINGSGFGVFTSGPINTGESFSPVAQTLVLGAGFDYVLNLSANDLPDQSVTGFDVTVNGVSFNSSPIALGPGSYDVVFIGQATAPDTGASLLVNATGTPIVSNVPVPAAAWLFGSALMGMVGVSRRKSASVAA